MWSDIKVITGSIDKDSKYRDTILSAVNTDSNHPINNGIDMQAHHLMSAKGVKDSELGSQLKSMGYDINVLKNLVLIPCTLPGACHLGVQLHRGNHTFEDDNIHPRSYHREVTERIRALESEMDKKCSKNKPIQGLINKESAKILNLVNKFKLPLTKIYFAFETSGQYKDIGCANTKKIPDHNKDNRCNSDRHHFTTIPQNTYTLRVGR